MRLSFQSLPFVPRKFARQQKIALPVGQSGRRLHIPVRWILLLVVVVFVIAGAALVVHAKLFTLQQPAVVELVHLEPSVVPVAELQAEANKLQNRSLLFIDSEQLRQQWLKQFPAIADMQIRKRYPHAIEIGYLPRIPMCQLITPKGSYLVDRDGFVFAKATASYLPSLTTDITTAEVGQTVAIEGVLLGLGLIDGLRATNPRLVSVVLHHGQLDIQLEGPPLIYVGDRQQLASVLSQTDTLMAKFQTEQKYPKELDFRFDRPVIRY